MNTRPKVTANLWELLTADARIHEHSGIVARLAGECQLGVSELSLSTDGFCWEVNLFSMDGNESIKLVVMPSVVSVTMRKVGEVSSERTYSFNRS